MLKTKRKRAVVLALIAFFLAGATTYVAVDWKRFGGGFLAYFKGKHDTTVATSGNSHSAGVGGHSGNTAGAASPAAQGPQLALAGTHRHASGTGGGSGGRKSDDEDLFKYGNPAAGGIPPGSFIVAQNEPGGAGNGGTPSAPESGGGPATSGPGVSSPAPAPTGNGGGPVGGGNGGAGDSGLPIVSKTPKPASPPTPAPSPSPASPPSSPTPTPAPGPVASPPTSQIPPAPAPVSDSPPAPAPATGQAGNTDSNPTGDDPTDGGGSNGTPTPPAGPGSVSAVPEASSLAMMSLGALFLAVAARRKDSKNG